MYIPNPNSYSEVLTPDRLQGDTFVNTSLKRQLSQNEVIRMGPTSMTGILSRRGNLEVGRYGGKAM